MQQGPTTIDWHTGVPLASGGSGEVVRAFSPALGCEIAIKYLRVEEPAAVERMLREARTQAALDHPNILPIHGTGVHLDRHFIAMDLVDGSPLDQALATFGVDARLAVFDQVLDAMACAHRRGVVHRDLKPANLLVESRDGDLHAWVMDFGLARRPDDATLTVAGDALGTPGYMSPEQARGVEGADPRSDVYSLGVVLYQLLAGQLPYTADTPMALVVQAAAGQIVPVTEIRRRLPDGLARIVVRCLETEPARRYADAAALRDDLRAFVDGGTVYAPHLGRRYRLARWVRSNPWRARLVASLAIFLFTSLVALLWVADRNRRALDAASELIAEAERARGDWYVDQLLPLHDQRSAEARARRTVEQVSRAGGRLTDVAAARVDAALADLLDAIGEESAAFERARSAWRGGVRTPQVAERAARARLQRFGARRLELGLTTDPASFEDLLDEARRSLRDDLQPFVDALDSSWRKRIEREVAVPSGVGDPLPRGGLLETPDHWQDALLELQRAAATAVEQLNVDGVSALDDLARVEARLAELLATVRSYRPAYLLGCQLQAARQALRTMGSADAVEPPSRSACDQGLRLDPDAPDLLAVSSMQLWQRAKDLRRNRESHAEPLERAIAQAELALQREPEHELAQIALGSALQVRARRQLADGEDPDPALRASIDWLERVHTARPNDLDIMNNLAVTWSTVSLARAGDGQPRAALAANRESLKWLERAAAAAPDDRRIVQNMLLAKVDLLYQASQLGEDPGPGTRQAVAALAALADRHPDYISPLNTLGLAWWTQGVWDARTGGDPGAAMRAAQSAFERALERRPDWESARINHAGVARQWYAMVSEPPSVALEALADAALATYRSLEAADGGKREFGCLIAEILAVRAWWRAGETAHALLTDALALSDPADNIEWQHADCFRVRARIGWTWSRGNGPVAVLESIWSETRRVAADSEDPDLLIHAARFAAAMGDSRLAEALRARLPEPFRARIDAGDPAIRADSS